MKLVSEVLRDAMVAAGQRGISLYRIAKECDLDDSIVYRFYHDECGLALTSVDRLCNYLGLQLTVVDGVRVPTVIPRKPRRRKSAAKKKSAKKATKKQATKKKKKKAVKKKKKVAKKAATRLTKRKAKKKVSIRKVAKRKVAKKKKRPK